MQAEVELALERPRTHAELEHALQSVAAETDRLSQLVGDLLLRARLEDGDVPIRRERVAVDDLIDNVVARFSRRARAAHREIDVARLDGHANIDRLRIEQALANLVENALRYGDGTVSIRSTCADNWLELHVIDEGAGFPPGFEERAFERFTRGDASRGSGGVGLGLAIVAAVAHAHGGSSTLTRPEPGGADVFIRVPLAGA